MSGTKPLSSSLVREKLRYILDNVERIDQILQTYPYEEIVSGGDLSDITERRLERCVNGAIDVNLHLIRSQKSEPPGDYKKSFLELGKLKILPEKLAMDLAPAAGTRNILVHEYDDLDSKKFYMALQMAVELFPKYVTAIQEWLK